VRLPRRTDLGVGQPEESGTPNRQEAVGGDEKEGEETVIHSEADYADQTFNRSNRIPSQPPAPAFWLICRCLNGRLHILTLDCHGPPDDAVRDESLPVFGHEEEAQMFLDLGGAGEMADVGDEGWMVRETGVEELLWLLCGPESARVKEVALDPLPEMAAEETVGLVTVFKERFIERLMAKGRHLRLCEPARGPRRAS
jgi:hypothetical protein